MNNIFSKITTLLFIIFIILSFKIINSNYYIDISNKEYLNNLFNLTFNYNNIFNTNKNDNNVNFQMKYIKKNEKYITESNRLFSLKSGIVYLIDNKLIIKQYDNYDFIIEGKINPIISNGDYVNSNMILGEYYEPFLIYLIKDNNIYSYEEYIQFIF